MRLIFAGTPEFAARALAALHGAGHEIALVLTQPDRPAGRGLKLAPSAVKALAQERGLEVYQPASLKDAQTQQRLRALGADLMVVAAYGLILPEPVLAAGAPRRSQYPRFAAAALARRGADPARHPRRRRAHRHLHHADGPRAWIPARCSPPRRCPIAADDTSASLHDKLAELGARLIVSALAQLERGELARPAAGGCAARATPPRSPRPKPRSTGARPRRLIERKVRAFNPQPGASTQLRGVGAENLARRRDRGRRRARDDTGGRPRGHRRRLRQRRAEACRNCSAPAASAWRRRSSSPVSRSPRASGLNFPRSTTI